VQPFYIFVSGGVSSGIGKGITTASIAKILQAKGFRVIPVKIDPYLNFDAGTMRPTEHGEVWVTEDGGEIDQDLGHYERFLDLIIPKENNITTGQIYWNVLGRERKGEYLGQTVEAIPHVIDEVYRRLRNIADNTQAEFVIVEIGGTVGEYQNEIYFRAARMMKTKGERVLFVHTVYLPILKHLGEMKTKPAQQSVEVLGKLGIQPDFLMCRGEKPIDEVRKRKLETFCYVPKERIISDHDIEPIYELPLILEEQDLGNKILKQLGLQPRESKLDEWKSLIQKIKNSKEKVRIGIVGKYFDIGSFYLTDSYVTVLEAIKHAAWNNSRIPEIIWIDSKEFEKDEKNLQKLKSVDALIVPGGFGEGGVEGKILAIKYARENNIPFLGLCYGLQLAVVEFARNVCGMKGANSTEVDLMTKYPVVDLLPWQKKILEESNYGATMRLGGQLIEIKKETLAHKIYGKDSVIERFRHRYEINPEYVKTLEENGFVFSGKSAKDEGIMQIGELPKHNYFIGTQAHPEFTSRPLRPNPMFDGLIKATIK